MILINENITTYRASSKGALFNIVLQAQLKAETDVNIENPGIENAECLG